MEYRLDGFDKPLKLTKTKEGYLQGYAVVTTFDSVLPYPEVNRKEFRPKDAVLNPDSVNSMKNKPITIDHPNDFLNSDNVGKHIVGFTGEDVIVDGNKVAINLTITHKDAIEAIKRGKRQLSYGYHAKTIPSPGSFDGKEYTHVQNGIKYNHLSLVDMARVGSVAYIHTDSITQENLDIRCDSVELDVCLDSLEENLITQEETMEKTQNQDSTAIESSVAVEESKIEAPVEVVKNDSLDDVIAKLSTILDGLQQIKRTDSEVDVDALVNERAKERVKLFEAAKKLNFNTDSLHDKSDREIMEHVLKNKNPDQKFDGKSDDYVSARFDSLVDNNRSEPIKRQMSVLATENRDSAKNNNVSFLDLINQNYNKSKII